MEKFSITLQEMYDIHYVLVKENFPNKSEDFHKEQARKRGERYFRVILKSKIVDKCQETYNLTKEQSQELSNQMVDKLPIELIPNIIEWLNDESISEINYNGVSIRRMMECCTRPFWEYVRAMLIYIECGEYEPDIWRKYLIGESIVSFHGNTIYIKKR